MTAIIKVYATITKTKGDDMSKDFLEEQDAAKVAQWVGECLENQDTRDSFLSYRVHSIEVEVNDQ
jgi:hypothetical protein